MDVTGPFHPGNDIEQTAKFMLIGTYTWLRPCGGGDPIGDDADEVKEPGGADPEDPGPQLESADDPEEHEDDEVGDAEEVHLRGVDGEGDGDGAVELGEERIDPQIEVLYVGMPTTGKSTEAVMSGVIELYLQLRVDHTIHTDRGREFTNQRLRAWMHEEPDDCP